MTIMQPPAIHAAPAAFVQARNALNGLGALFTIADPGAWNSLARPQTDDLAALVYAIGGKFDEGLADLGLDHAPPAR